MIKQSEKSMVPKLKELWTECFPKDKQCLIDLFFEKRFSAKNTLIYLQDGDVAAALYLLPAHIVTKSSLEDMLYVYAVGTFKQYRGRGFVTELLEEARKTASKRGVKYLTLAPVGKYLFEFYGKRGYRTAFYADKLDMSRSEAEAASVPCKSRPISDDRILFIRNRTFWYDGFVVWDKPSITHSRMFCELSKGGVVSTESSYAMYIVEHGILKVLEFAGKKEDFGKICRLLLDRSGTDSFSFTFAHGFFKGKKNELAMLLDTGNGAYEAENSYIGLTLE